MVMFDNINTFWDFLVLIHGSDAAVLTEPFFRPPLASKSRPTDGSFDRFSHFFKSRFFSFLLRLHRLAYPAPTQRHQLWFTATILACSGTSINVLHRHSFSAHFGLSALSLTRQPPTVPTKQWADRRSWLALLPRPHSSFLSRMRHSEALI